MRIMSESRTVAVETIRNLFISYKGRILKTWTIRKVDLKRRGSIDVRD